ncbi:MAG: pyruvate dehydrogenase (acetyl-transferring) E1 component subunit alpha [Coxiellaceae bacterium]|nr:pyruvate dehydrogenase (acetyl-transferring) E1 component subunit alpha [Coxiellaceae bacterium]
MDTKSIASFEVKHLQYLDAASKLTQDLPEFASVEELLHMYKLMCLTRALDNKAINLQRTGRMGTYPAATGQEAVGVGMGTAMAKGDVYCPYYRDQACFLARGVKPEEILAYWGGDERGSDFESENCKHDLPICVPIAGQCLHATGVGYAFKYRKQPHAVMTICGEGGTSKGDFYEAMNLAGDWQLPVVFIVNNNQWAISVARKLQTGCDTIAQKAIAAGFEGIQVDGNDVIAMRQACDQALEKARSGGGPTLIEAVTYRLCDHTTADDATRYVPPEELETAWKEEPIVRLRTYLHENGHWDKDKETALQKTCSEQVEQAVKDYEAMPAQDAEAIFDCLYATLPVAYLDQLEDCKEANA